MKIILPGGAGHVGNLLARHFHERGDEVVVLSRRPQLTPWRTVAWDGVTVGPWARELDGADVVINLAGRSVNCRYDAKNRHDILQSRVLSTKAIGQAIQSVSHRPRVWLQMSTATIYAHRYDHPNDEITGILGGSEPNVPETWKFSVDVARAWEASALEHQIPRVRQVLLRTAMVMSPDPGGVFDVLLRLVRLGLGGTNGDGKQYVSWIHERDFVRAIDWLIERDDLAGPVNLAAPGPLPNAEFLKTLRQSWGARFGLPASRWMLEIGAFLMRTETELILKSRRVSPTRLVDSGFQFDFVNWQAAAKDLCFQKSRAKTRSRKGAENQGDL